ATYQCPSELPFSVTHQCQSVHISVPASATYSASQCRLTVPSVPVSTTYQYQSVPPINAIYQCCLSVPISDACQCPSVPPTSASSSVSISAAYQCPSLQPH
ncbi:unnamed protein product, partial [Staurois parvus]